MYHIAAVGEPLGFGLMVTITQAADLIEARVPEGDTSRIVSIERYYVEHGDVVLRGDPVALLRSHRFVFDLPAETEGKVTEFLVATGNEVDVGEPLIRLLPLRPVEQPRLQPDRPERQRHATPLARNLARAHGLDLELLEGLPAGRRIRVADVRAAVPELAAEEQARAQSAQVLQAEPKSVRIPVPPEADRRRTFGPRAASTWIPRAMTAFMVVLDPTAGPAPAERERLRRRGIEVNPANRIVHAALAALPAHPFCNSRWTDESIILHGRIHLGVASHREGEIDRVIPNATDLSPEGLARALASGLPTPPGMDTPSFAVDYVDEGLSWWKEPASDLDCAAILGIGTIQPQLVAIEREHGTVLAPRLRAILTLWYDARVLTQAAANAFLREVCRRVARQQI